MNQIDNCICEIENRNWELLGAWVGAKVTVPAKFIIGDKDIGIEVLGTMEYVKGSFFKSLVPNLEDIVILDGHHFIQQEKAQQVNHEILSFLQKFTSQ